ncbi:uncharacterized protein LOC110845132 isoform X1 [Folsomia candida]|uniref:uncharacterized protein LOC110845132 isoform X1 n=1 Tax=Folsomia candida TaxID=158441 RepID=UPI000B8F7FD3|nr:uncharacterized protein LOC110845132 isoform X1 [Folsomia candida]
MSKRVPPVKSMDKVGSGPLDTFVQKRPRSSTLGFGQSEKHEKGKENAAPRVVLTGQTAINIFLDSSAREEDQSLRPASPKRSMMTAVQSAVEETGLDDSGVVDLMFSDDGETGEEEEAGTLENTEEVNPQPGPSRGIPIPHYRHGDLSDNVYEQFHREVLLDWLEEVRKMKPPVRNDTKRLELENAANWGQQRRKGKLVVQFDTKIPGSPIKGYYVMKADGWRNNLFSYFKRAMKDGISLSHRERNMAYRDPHHPLYDTIKDSNSSSGDKRPPLDIVYIATLFPKEHLKISLIDIMKKELGPVLESEPLFRLLYYIGIFAGRCGYFSMRDDHFTATLKPSHIYIRTVGSPNPLACMQNKVILCDSTATKQALEGFLMAYARKTNEVLGYERYIDTETASPDFEYIKKAIKYADDKIPLFRIVEKGDRSHPPLWANMEQATTLPYTITEEELILRFDPDRPEVKRHYKSFQDMAHLISEVGDPPERYFYTNDKSRNEFKEEFDKIKAAREDKED